VAFAFARSLSEGKVWFKEKRCAGKTLRNILHTINPQPSLLPPVILLAGTCSDLPPARAFPAGRLRPSPGKSSGMLYNKPCSTSQA
jgi:hypothetical protein